MTDDTATAFATACGSYPAALALRLSGAYRLSDAGLLALLRSMPSLRELALPQCSRLVGPAVEQFPALVPGLRWVGARRGCGVRTGQRVMRQALDFAYNSP